MWYTWAMPTTKGDNMANVKLTRTNNMDGSYKYTHNEVAYEIINFKGYGLRDEWQVKVWDTNETIAYFDTLKEVREFFANGMWG